MTAAAAIPPRLAALRVLLAVDHGRTTLAAEVDRARRGVPDERDRALLVELTAGTLRWRAALDALLAQCSRRPLDQLTPAIRGILRLAAYQLERLDRIPAHAVLNESVELARAVGEARAAGFVNAVLRTLLRTRARLSLPARAAPGSGRSDQLAYLATTLSHPEWLVARWLERHGFDATERWCRFNNAPPEVTVRALDASGAGELMARLQAAGLASEAAAFVREAVTLGPGVLGRVPAGLAGEILVQDEASQIVAHAAGAVPGERVLDLCAAPGAKTIVIAADMEFRGALVAADFRPSRVRLLRRMLRRASAATPVIALDATRPLPFGPVFDRVVVDAPCSGLGVVRRDPDLKWSRQPDDLAGFAAVQQRMLTQAAEAVAPGGRLIYATCSSEPEENENVIRAFAARDDRFGTGAGVAGISRPGRRGADRRRRIPPDAAVPGLARLLLRGDGPATLTRFRESCRGL